MDCIIQEFRHEAFRESYCSPPHKNGDHPRPNKIEIYALITASPFSFQDRQLVLLVIEDISEIAELYRMIPICSVCGKVRDDKESWMRVEAYFKNNWDVDFSHGLCPGLL